MSPVKHFILIFKIQSPFRPGIFSVLPVVAGWGGSFDEEELTKLQVAATAEREEAKLEVQNRL